MSMTSSRSTHSLYRTLYRELSRQHISASKLHMKDDLKKTEALHKYKVMKAASLGLPESSVEMPEPPKISRFNSEKLRSYFLTNENNNTNSELAANISIFLNSQRQYNELLEYYNGSTIDEENRIKLSARRVGLELPDTDKNK